MPFDAIVIGTGFGATVAAIDLAAKNKQVLLLERGLWWVTPERPLPDWIRQRSQGEKPEQPVQYWPRPDHSEGLIDFLSVVRSNSPLENLRHLGDFFRKFFTGKLAPQPLYRYQMFPEIHIVTASGVGGGSLIYSNVTLEPKLDPATGQYPVMSGWPLKLTPQDYNNARAWMTNNRGTLSRVVTRVPVPSALGLDVANLPKPYEFLYLWKSQALRYAVQQMGARWEPLDLAIIEYDGITKPGTTTPSDAAVNATFCQRQGRCFSGCLPAARHTLNKTLLKTLLAVAKPVVVLRSLSEVDHLEKADGGYKVVYRDLRDGSEQSESAPIVILAAGCLGSTELLLRSRKYLTLSDALGTGFSSNGDFAGFVEVPPTSPVYPLFPTKGPINTCHAMFQDGQLQMTIEDSAIPPMFAGITRAALDVLDNVAHREPFMKAMRGLWLMGQTGDLHNLLPRLPDPSDPLQFQTEHEMVSNVFFFNCMGTDSVRGKFELDNSGKLTLSFGGKLANDPVFAKIEGILKAIGDKMQGQYAPFPLWGGFGTKKAICVHPLGGCPIGGSSTEGVVDYRSGQVFNTRSGSQAVYKGLYVLDGSIIPGPLAVNPSLTIVALVGKLAAGIA